MTTYTSSAAKMHSGYDIRDEHGKMVAIVHSPQGDTLRGERVAHLMASAPALLAAAKKALDLLETPPWEPTIPPTPQAQDALHDAIVAAQVAP